MQRSESKTPELKTLGDVVRWVVAELGAMCPGPERLAAYFANPDDANLRDVRYHVEEVRCPICRTEREAIQRATSD
ncbi:hypothetical protein THTE_1772 [Thermogutta terrifontis]|uniref:Uncharacterized protein n=1 Tax=Thermogutta terrifontis TaxID=1331910 RepID=A0A286REH6_9BACT|nr:hypothetical protein [Thermogutta terrifontis]ASV74374.1 hypothetical protein THTE_1772 [Thermogutta terrifontis]